MCLVLFGLLKGRYIDPFVTFEVTVSDSDSESESESGGLW